MSRSITDTVSDKEWRARNDADTLAQAKAIMADKARMAAARKIAPTLTPDLERYASEAKAKLAAIKSLSKSAPKKRK